MPTIKIDDIEFAYETSGEGPPLLLLHGGEGDRTSYNHFIPRFDDRYTVIVYDQRDSGESTGTERQYDMYQHAADAAGLLSALGIERASVYGQSYGGAIAQALAIAYPEKVDKLMLGSTSPGKPLRHERREEINVYIDAFIARQPLTPLSPSLFFSPGAFDRKPELQNFFKRNKIAPPDSNCQRRRLIAIEEFDSMAQLSKIQAPTLLIAGWQDQILNPIASWTLAKGIPSARLVVLEDAGHAITWEAPNVVGQLMRSFLEE